MARDHALEEVLRMLEEARTRPAQKRLGRILDEDASFLRPVLLAEARRRGVELPDEALCWPGKRFLRLALGREGAARRRINPVKLDEPFRCLHCGAEVPAGGRTPRDHCPLCLRSLHVDVVPGARDADCGGIMDPIGLVTGGRVDAVIAYRCRRCGYERQNRALLDGASPDAPAALLALSIGAPVGPSVPSDPPDESPTER
jgi:predicted RNA-binding Zn-ribbon protein involved in translation (DUF1610 family)